MGIKLDQAKLRTGLLGLVCLLFPIQGLAQSLTIQGKVLDGANNPVSGSATQFRVQILTADSQRCVLFDETHTIDLSNTNGLFSINLNDGLGTTNAPTTYTLEQALSNRTSFSLNSSYCASGSGTLTYTPAANDNRKVVIQFKDPGTMLGFETIPEMDLNPVAWAMESRSVGGFPSASLLRVVAGGIPGSAPSLTTADVTELQSLLSGTSNKYLSKDTASGATLPSYSGGPATPNSGSMWFDSSGTGTIKFKDSNGTIQTLGTGSGSGTLTSVTGNNGLTASTTSGAVTVGMTTLSPSPAGSVGSATAVPVITVDAYGRVITATSTPITGLLPSGTAGEFLKYSAGAWTSSVVRMSDLKNASGGTSLFGANTCSASETFYWDSVNDQFKCQSIALGAPSATVAATYTKVTVAADGRVNGGSATIGDSDISGLAWSKITGAPSFVTNGGNASSLVANNTGSKPGGQVAGRIYVDVSNQKISYDNGTAWVDVSGSASAAPAASVSAPLTSTAGTIGIPQATGSQDGFLSSADWTSFTGKLSKALSSAHLFVGNGSGQATDVAVSGDVSLANSGKFTVTGIRDQAVSGAGSALGQVLRYSATDTWTPQYLTMADLRSTVTGTSALTGGCSSAQTLTWNSGTDSLQCQGISIAASSQISGVLPIANGGTGANSTSQGFVFAGPSSGAGAPAFRALAASDLPVEAKLWATDGTNVYRTSGSVGIGSAVPTQALDVAGHGQFKDGPGNYINIGTSVPSGAKGAYLLYDSVTDATSLQSIHQGTAYKTLLLNANGGKVGIGTTDPAGALHVGSSASASLKIGQAASGAVNVTNATAQFSGTAHAFAYDAANYSEVGAVAHDTYNDGSSPTFSGTFLRYRGTGMTGNDYGLPQAQQGQLIFQNVANANIGTNGSELTISPAGIPTMRFNTTGKIGIGTTAPTVSLDLATRTDAIRLPAGTAAQQPGQTSMPAAANGMIRYNTSTNALEAYVNGAWTNLATVGGTQSFAGNVSVGGTLTSSGAATFNGGATITGGALNMSSQNITGVGSSITGSSGLTVASGGSNTNLSLTSSGSGAVNVGSTNGVSLSALDGGVNTVNYVTVKGAASGASPMIGTGGLDTNIDLTFAPKGSGRSVFSSGNVGIGTTNPGAKLHVLSTGQYDLGGQFSTTSSQTSIFNHPVLGLTNLDSSAVNNGVGLRFGGTSTNGTQQMAAEIGAQNTAIAATTISSDLYFLTNNAGTGGERMRITAGGNVGIGTTAPRAVLHAVGGNGAPSLSTNGNPAAVIGGSSTVQLDVGNYDPGTGYTTYIQGKQATNSGVAFPIALNPLGGNVGVGTNNPATTLHVYGSTTIPAQIDTSATGSYLKFATSGTSRGLFGYSATGVGGLAFVNAAGTTPNLLVSDAGNVGVGTTTPIGLFNIHSSLDPGAAPGTSANYSLALTSGAGTGASTGIGFGVGNFSTNNVGAAIIHKRVGLWGSGELQFYTGSYSGSTQAPSQRMVISSGGNVGIGTASPGAPLHVYGTGTGTVPANSGTSDATVNGRFCRGIVCNDIGTIDNGTGYIQGRQFGNLANTTSFSINPNGGSVGIGTIAPTAALDVNGKVRATASLAYGSITGSISTSSTADVFDATALAQVVVQANDIVKVDLACNLYNTSGQVYMRAALAGGSATALQPPNWIIGGGSSLYSGGASTGLFRASADGPLSFEPLWHVSGGTGSASYCNIVAVVIGR